MSSGTPSAAVDQPPTSTMLSGGVHPMEGGHPLPSSPRDPHGDHRYAGFRGGPPLPPGSYGGSYSPYPRPYGGPSMYGGPSQPGFHRGAPPSGSSHYPPPPPPHSSPYAYAGYSPASLRHPPPQYPGYGAYDYPGGPPPSRGPPGPSSYRGSSPVGGRAPGTNGSPGDRASSSNGLSRSPPQLSHNDADESSGRSPGGSPGSGPAVSGVLPPHLANGKLANNVEVDRLRAAAATEITTEEVKPIQTDFHFFARENMVKYRKLAEDEVRKSMNMADNEDLDPFLVNTNLNTRLMKAWEALSKDQRDAYMVQEEDDRRRFMEEDEIASRHCATLTARGKSPNSNRGAMLSPSPDASILEKTKSIMEKARCEERQENKTTTTSTIQDLDESKSTMNDSEHNEEKKAEEGDDIPKRPTPKPSDNETSNVKDSQDSPTKKIKIDPEERE